MWNKSLLSFLHLLGKTFFSDRNMIKLDSMMLSNIRVLLETLRLNLLKGSTLLLEKEESIYLEDKRQESV